MTDAMRRAKDKLVDMTREAAASKDILKEAFRRAYFGRVTGVYDLLSKELDAKLKASIGTVANISRESAFADLDKKPPRVLAWDQERLDNYWAMISPPNAPSLAAVFTNKMASEDIRELRTAVIQVFRTADLEALTANQRIKALQSAWDTAAGNKAASRFVDRSGTEWTNARYLQMLVRTTQQRIARESYIDTVVQNGDDLMRIQAAGDNCEKCDTWNGLIISVTGTNPDFPSYEDALESGWGHPNCDCQLERVDETIDEAATAAQGDTPNPDDWTDLEEVRAYKEKAGVETPERADAFDFAGEFNAEFDA